jgi:uncharacterized membrane protein
MEWLVIAGLGVWVWLQSRRIDTLTRRLATLEHAAAPATAPEAADKSQLEPLLLTTPAPPEDEEPLLLDTPIANDEDEPLLLDTPLPEASNDDDDWAKPLPPIPEAARPAPHRAKRELRFDQWLAENGLAWLAGGAFALGAIFLVSFAAQQDWFTPPVQLACALALGLALIGVSEWARRGNVATASARGAGVYGMVCHRRTGCVGVAAVTAHRHADAKA